MKSCFMDVIEKRRSIYHLNRKISLSEHDFGSLIENCIKFAPSAFNSQTARVVILFGENHQKLWQIVRDILQKIVPEDKFASTATKIESFAAGFGTILFFEDQSAVAELQQKFPLYADRFPIWSEQGAGILQFVVWAALAEQNIGASLQHYNPLIDDEVRRSFNLPNTWKLNAQMPFGGIGQPAEPKTFKPLDERLKIFY